MTTQTETAIVKDYVNAGGLRTYYEAQGTGDTLIMLHGGFASPHRGHTAPSSAESPGDGFLGGVSWHQPRRDLRGRRSHG